ncbi:MAG: hypothetical protein A2306_01560 [Omnitrophica WOR_2 bacterium RIFOXYB2_FULL_38_16]|nr:MAG: hypothetical protein A2Y06_03765 [Omnitrophica WOR_2 bacterium GWA2_37_7]OGX50995.1 MAG: hypothetical protein A2243_09315 [Omnitrophica WOR_2 bacterium RIFOXYA2_FULL_38_17]OGX53787.1 MAG: hypothetical protein A2267_01500 [Omnitrophica WOR_2 bacterium RIFOXYA12_FULL_38_10]OGX58273.1 MAG: hypothetical protein A2447_02400 [Omnitrophica WOR_2 bacterium RIFOXYC2_FULL_38_12]OGX60059.1 MAG: hypothetical protein A2306_01560 [Omnitrophica WOR_2 bacterium RIFOXYB2_FULL_38_16]HBG60676.1 hypotheti
MVIQPKQIALLIVGVLFLIILLQNTHVIMLHFLFWVFGMSQIILIPLIMAVGFGIGYFCKKI